MEVWGELKKIIMEKLQAKNQQIEKLSQEKGIIIRRKDVFYCQHCGYCRENGPTIEEVG